MLKSCLHIQANCSSKHVANDFQITQLVGYLKWFERAHGQWC